MLCKLCGEPALRSVVLVTNMWFEVPHNVGEAREEELSSIRFRPALNEGSQMVRHHNTVQSAHNIVRRIVENHPISLLIQRELADERKDIINTAAGKALNRQFNEQIRRYRTWLREVRETVQVLMDMGAERVPELEETRGRLQERMRETVKGLEGISANYTAEEGRIETKIKEMEYVQAFLRLAAHHG